VILDLSKSCPREKQGKKRHSFLHGRAGRGGKGEDEGRKKGERSAQRRIVPHLYLSGKWRDGEGEKRKKDHEKKKECIFVAAILCFDPEEDEEGRGKRCRERGSPAGICPQSDRYFRRLEKENGRGGKGKGLRRGEPKKVPTNPSTLCPRMEKEGKREKKKKGGTALSFLSHPPERRKKS